MNTDTQGTGTLPAPRSYMVVGHAEPTLVQARRASKVAFRRYWWDLSDGTHMLAGERPDHMTFTYEQDRALREQYA